MKNFCWYSTAISLNYENIFSWLTFSKFQKLFQRSFPHINQSKNLQVSPLNTNIISKKCQLFLVKKRIKTIVFLRVKKFDIFYSYYISTKNFAQNSSKQNSIALQNFSIFTTIQKKQKSLFSQSNATTTKDFK